MKRPPNFPRIEYRRILVTVGAIPVPHKLFNSDWVAEDANEWRFTSHERRKAADVAKKLRVVNPMDMLRPKRS